MVFPKNGEGPVVLQLHRWDPSHIPINLSEYCEAFISPTKELLLLLSNQNEALLFPLSRGDTYCITHGSSQYQGSENKNSSACMSDSLENIPSTSESVETVSSNGCFLDSNLPRSNTYPFVYDVHSMAWGLCGDEYKQPRERLFTEYLFVVGNTGLTIHAFRRLDKTDEVVRQPKSGNENSRGRWVEWGPSITEAPGNATAQDSDSHRSSTLTSKKWLRSFLSSAKTLKSDGSIWTCFPDESTLPCLATVVSFNVSFNDSLLFGLYSGGDSVMYECAQEDKPIHGAVNIECNQTASNGFKSDGDVSVSKSYSCIKVFPGCYHHLTGFVLSSECGAVEKSKDHSFKSQNINVVVARLDFKGLQWLYSVRLPLMDASSESEWIDFQISDKFLISLNNFGFILFHGAMTGEYITYLDVLQTYGKQNLIEKESFSFDVNSGSKDDALQNKLDGGRMSTSQTHSTVRKRRFQRLIIAPYSSLFTVVDQCGVVYVICASDHVPDKYFLQDKLLPQYLRLGMLAPWEAGYSDISQQKLFETPSSCEKSVNSFSKNKNDVIRGNLGSSDFQRVHNWHIQGMVNRDDLRLTGFSSSQKSVKMPADSRCSWCVRKIFLPIARLRPADTVCFSPLGITRLVRRNITESGRSCIVHTSLYIESNSSEDTGSNYVNRVFDLQSGEGEAIGCIFQGCLYLVTKKALSVVLPTVSMSSNSPANDLFGGQWIKFNQETPHYSESSLIPDEPKQLGSPWQMTVLDRLILYEGPVEADFLCLENGWDLKISRLCRLQLALAYLRFEEMEKALEMLVEVNIAEEGIWILIFGVIYMMVRGGGNDAEVSAALRILSLATCFTIKMLREYSKKLEVKNECVIQKVGGIDNSLLALALPSKEQVEFTESRRLHEIAYSLEIIRNLQSQLAAKFKRPGQELLDDLQTQDFEEKSNLSQDDYHLSIIRADAISSEKPNNQEPELRELEMGVDDTEKLALMPVESLASGELVTSEMQNAVSHFLPGVVPRTNLFPVENPQEMFARWKGDHLDLKTVVRDALLSGRLPLAVLQLQLHRVKDLVDNKNHIDTFAEVRDIGRAIAYELLLKGETALAVTTLQKLGEDIETCLKQLLFGTVDRLLRKQIADEVKKYGYLRSYEQALLDRISLIERVYPCSSFWKTYAFQKNEVLGGLRTIEAPGEYCLCLLHPPAFRSHVIKCGDIDGVVLGSWDDANASSSEVDDDSSHAGYWAAAAVWSNAWDQKTIDRILLDQPSLLGVHVMWESQFEYHVCHNDWEEVSKLLDMIPNSLLLEGSLLIRLDGLKSVSSIGCNVDFLDYSSYACSPDELDAVCIEIPNIRILKSTANITFSSWLRVLIGKELAKRFIFLKEFWYGTDEIIFLLAQSGYIAGEIGMASQTEYMHHSANSDSTIAEAFRAETVQAFHKLVVHHCAQYNLPYFLDLYLDHHKLDWDNDTMSSLQEASGDCQWAKWLLFSSMSGREYEASFSNARAVLVRNVVHDSSFSALEANEVIGAVDDMAEAGWLMGALATLMFAPVPIQNCLCSGSVKRSNSSYQCTLENLSPALQKFPTLWRILVSACLGQDTTQSLWGLKGRNALSVYINWRDSVFYSSGHDTSLHQMLPSWFPKNLRRLIQLFVQGPLGWQSMAGLAAEEAYLQRDVESLLNDPEYSEISAVSWEEAIQRQIELELSPSVEETGLALEQHLHRGRALGAFNQLLGYRVQKLKSGGSDRRQSSTRGKVNVQSDVQMLLASLSHNEESLLSSVVPLAITHYQDSVLVASCAFLLELCGLSASILRVDVAALRRIHSFYKSNLIEQQKKLLSNGAALHSTSNDATVADSLAQALADYYLHNENGTVKREGARKPFSHQQPSQPLMLVLQHLEKASILAPSGEKTCGSWLLSGDGDGTELRSQQKVASQHWKLVTVFCQMHQLQFSTVYMSSLARDNDWVGFLTEAQIGGYPNDLVVQVAGKDFTDLRLRTHILTVLRGTQSRKKASLSSSLDSSENRSECLFSAQNSSKPAELFQILAESERQKQPGKTLLLKAKELSWSLLAIVASCFPDVAPLSCLTVWLEITAARETSSIRENDIACEVSKNVGAAVEALNSLPTDDRVPIFHYNRKNSKRRRLIDQVPEDFSASFSDTTSSTRARVLLDAKQGGPGEDVKVSNDTDNWTTSLPKLVAVLCQQRQFLPLLRAFEMFLPSCSLLPFIRALQAFSQMRLSEASAHLGSFAIRIKEEPSLLSNFSREGTSGTSWVSSTAMKAADAILSTCPSPYEKRCLLHLLASTEFGDEGSAAAHYQRQHWKISLAEPALRKHEDLQLGNQILDDASLLTTLENNGYWEQARNWAQKLEASGGPWKAAVHHVTERQAESMVTEWKEFLWDVPEERVALWRHCQNLFLRYSFPALRAGLFFLKHAEDMEKEVPPKELHELLLLSLQWLSGMITPSNPVCPLHLLREIETRAWLLAVESEAQLKSERGSSLTRSSQYQISESSANIVDQTADLITKMDSHINMSGRVSEKTDLKENARHHNSQPWDAGLSTTAGSTKAKRRTKTYVSSRRSVEEVNEIGADAEESSDLSLNFKYDSQDESLRLDASFSNWDERIGPAELERAVLSLLEFGQVTAAKQLQHKLSSGQMPVELRIVDAALKFAGLSTPLQKHPLSLLDDNLRSLVLSYNIPTEDHLIDPFQALDSLAGILAEGCGRGLCKRIIAVVKAANILDIPFLEAFEKLPTELLQLLSLKAQDSFEEARLLVQMHPMPATSIAKILAESFLKGLLAAHRGGYIDSQKEEGPAPLLWRFLDFLKWAELCPSEQEIGHALMRLVITGQEIPHACEVELLILSHHFYQSSACLDGVDVLMALAATRVEAYVSENDFSCLARLITGVGNFHALNFILGILIENGQLDLLLHKFSSAADANSAVAETVRGFRMAVVTALKHFNPTDYDSFAMVYKHFDMKHETASLLELRALESYRQWNLLRRNKDQNEGLLESMRYYIEAAEVYSSIDAGNKTHSACAQASLVSLQIRMPDLHWLNLSETNARYLLANQSRFQEALIVAEAYKLNHPSEWTPVLWDQMLKPIAEEYIAEFVAVLPLQPSTLIELANLYKREIQARGDQSHITTWFPGGGLPEWVKQLGRSFRCLLKRTRDLRCRLQMATIATGFLDVIHTSNKALDKVPDNAGPLVLRKGHGGAYLPLM